VDAQALGRVVSGRWLATDLPALYRTDVQHHAPSVHSGGSVMSDEELCAPYDVFVWVGPDEVAGHPL
jgi:hypothetical protein